MRRKDTPAKLKRTRGTGQKGKTKGGYLPSPYSGAFQLLSIEEQTQAYRDAVNRVQSQLNKLKKEGVAEYNPAYRAIKEAGNIKKSGNVGFQYKYNISKKGEFKKEGEVVDRYEYTQGLIEEYKKVYYYRQGGQSTLFTSNIEMHQKRTQWEIDHNKKSKLARLGIRAEYMDKESNKKKINDYWELYNKLQEAGVFKNFGLDGSGGSDDAQDITMRFFQRHKNIDIDRVVEELRRDSSKVVADTTGGLPTTKFYNYYFRDKMKDSDIIDDEIRKFAQMLAAKHYSQKPKEVIFENGVQDLGELMANQ